MLASRRKVPGGKHLEKEKRKKDSENFFFFFKKRVDQREAEE